MSSTTKLLYPIRQSLCHSFSRSSLLLRCRFQPPQTSINHFSPSIRRRFTEFIFRASHSNAYLSVTLVLITNSAILANSCHYVGSSLSCTCPIIGMAFSPLAVAFPMDGEDVLVDDREYCDKEVEEDWGVIWMAVRKMWVPIVFFITVFANWYHPLMLLAKVSLLLFTTKPAPLSAYIFVDRLCKQSMRQQPYLYFIKTMYAKKVEVQDYKLLCIATVEIREQKITLVGILGGWWAFPLSQQPFSVFWAGLRYKFTQ